MSITSSADGLKLALTANVSSPGVSYFGRVYTSSDGGDTWFQQMAAPVEINGDIAGSADGIRLFLAGQFIAGPAPITFGKLYLSEDSGLTWKSADAPVNPFDASRQIGWEYVASSADGNQLAATPYFFADLIYTRGSGILKVTYEIRPQPETPNQFLLCDDFQVVAKVTNISSGIVTDLVPSTAPTKGTDDVLKVHREASPGTGQTLQPGASVEFTWTLRASKIGDATLQGEFTGKARDVPFTANSAANFSLRVLEPELIVNMTSDEPDADPLDGCADVDLEMGGRQTTLRAAIETANVLASLQDGAPRKIYFDIPGEGVPRIVPTSPLPPVTKSVEILGGSQKGGWVELNGAAATGLGDGLELRSKSIVRRMVINGWKRGGLILSGTGGHSVFGCRIGTDAIGSASTPNKFGIAVLSPGNTIGGGDELGNLISGNRESGITIEKVSGLSAPTGNRIVGNRIGTNADGMQALKDQTAGVSLRDAGNNTIGEAGLGNLISGNTAAGVALAGGEAKANVVQANLIGTNAGGLAAVENLNGVVLRANANNNIIGGDTAGAANVISGNGAAGVRMQEVAFSNQIIGNLIGLDQSGKKALPNNEGIFILDGLANQIGGVATTKRNVIAGNLHHGIALSASRREVPEQRLCNGTVIEGNWIGLSKDGLHPVPNGSFTPLSDAGIALLTLAQNTIIGGNEPGQGNVISGNTGFGVAVAAGNTFVNAVVGNRIGVLPDGVTPAGNSGSGVGVGISSESKLVVGGTPSGAGNRIAYNGGHGVDLRGMVASAEPSPVLANEIFRNKGRAIALADKRPVNDLGDADSGPNSLQNYPFLRNVRNITGGTRVLVDLKTFRLNETYRLDFYRHQMGDRQSGGEAWLAALSVLTGSEADGQYVASLPLQFSGSAITATATDSAGNTSEFSNVAIVSAAIDRDRDGIPDDEETAGGRVPTRTRSFAAGDGNGDGVADAEQANVATMLLGDTGWASLTAPGAVTLQDLQVDDTASYRRFPQPWVTKREVVTFTLVGVAGADISLTWIEAPGSEVQQLWRWTGLAWVAASAVVTTDEPNGTRAFTVTLPATAAAKPIALARAFVPPSLPALSITTTPDLEFGTILNVDFALTEIGSYLDPETVRPPTPSPFVPGRRVRLTLSPPDRAFGGIQWSRDLGSSERWQDLFPVPGATPGQFEFTFPGDETQGYFRVTNSIE